MVTACLRDPATTMPQAQRGGSSSDGGEGAKDQGLTGECQQQLTADGRASCAYPYPYPHPYPYPYPYAYPHPSP